jgi:hypothetical protein
MDISTGEGDLMDVQYHRHDMFQKAKQDGYDGIKIDDFAQLEEYGNFGHASIGLFYKDKIRIKKIIDASHPEEGAFKNQYSKEYVASLAEQLLKESRSTLYHQTEAHSLMNIVKRDMFILSFAPRRHSDTEYSKVKSHPYYMSMARTQQNRFMDNQGRFTTIIELDGYKLQSKYPIVPYSY